MLIILIWCLICWGMIGGWAVNDINSYKNCTYQPKWNLETVVLVVASPIWIVLLLIFLSGTLSFLWLKDKYS